MLGLLVITLILVGGLGLVLVLTDLVTVPPAVRANASKIATVMFLALITWFFVAYAMAQPT